MTPFECDLCIFRKLKSRDPFPNRAVDQLLCQAICRVCLDAFWSRSSAAVTQNAGVVQRMLKCSVSLELSGPFPDFGPYPPFDHCGYEIAINMVIASLKPGRHTTDHLQFDTICKLRSAFSNFIRAAPFSNAYPWVVGDGDGKHFQRLALDPCGSLWFLRFIDGCKKRMGQDWRPDQAISVELLLAVLEYVDAKITETQDSNRAHLLTLAGAFFAVTFVILLRGPEGLLLDLEGLIKERNRNTSQYIILALWGEIKGEHHERAHLLPSVNRTGSGIKIREWVGKAVSLAQAQGRSRGSLMLNHSGKKITSNQLNEIFHEALTAIYRAGNVEFSTCIKSEDDIPEHFNTFRSMRRGSDTRAHEEGVSKPDIDIVNRWKAEVKAGTRKPGLSISQMYTDPMLLLKPFLRYTAAM
jgi:hypothetical protein